MRNSFRLIAVVLAVVIGVAGCGSDRSGGPKGDPTTIVATAPDRTLAAGTAKVAVATANSVATGTIDFGTGAARMHVTPATATEPELTNPVVAIDIVRAVASVDPYGGAEVRGASTIKYELDIAPGEELTAKLGGGLRGPTFYADVYVDSQLRIRRVTLPVDLNERRPSDTHQILAKLITIDFYDFGSAS
ncbi:MAG TPA: hypothetical protein VFB78_12680 [Acidimicrobiales bacterium]|nr:hypothetical protein [Acidimicrobiales bacterium]